MAIAANFMSLKKYYLAQASLIETLKATRTRLRAEVAERQAAEMAARNHEIALRKTMEASLDAITIKRVRDDVYVEVNEEFARMTGYRREQLMGRPAEALHIWNDPVAGSLSLFATPGLTYLTDTYQISVGVQIPLTHGAEQNAQTAVVGAFMIFMDKLNPAFAWMPF